jgi:hypothetical protein
LPVVSKAAFDDAYCLDMVWEAHFLSKALVSHRARGLEFIALPDCGMGQILHSNIELNCFASGKMISSYKGEYMC